MKILIFFGTRPEFIKLYPVIHNIRKSYEDVELLTVNTGQQRDLVDQTLSNFNFTCERDFDVMSQAFTVSQVTSKILEEAEKVLLVEKPDIVMVQGDTSSAYAVALAAFLQQVKVVHIEAGLRSFNNLSPFPEEMFRKLISLMSSYHFAPTIQARKNLINEGVSADRIRVVGNTGIDTLRMIQEELNLDNLNQVSTETKKILVTFHRRENIEKAIYELCCALKELAATRKDVTINFILHPNLEVKAKVKKFLSDTPEIKLVEPVPYKEFVLLLSQANVVITDSGGIQEEATYLAKKLLIVRNETERSEALLSKTARLVVPDRKYIKECIDWSLELRDTQESLFRLEFGDGYSANRILETLMNEKII